MKNPILYFTFCFLICTTSQAFAQQTKPAAAPKPAATQQKGSLTNEQRAEQITISMVKNLGLNSVQTAKVRKINLQSVEQMEASKVKHQKNPRAMVAEADLISQSRLSRIKDVLTQEQFNKYQRKREEEMGISTPANSAQPSGIKVPGSDGYSN